MIDRSYLPFPVARDYQDRKMAKWMGFFLSEHSAALSDSAEQEPILSDLSLPKKLMLLSQLYANQLRARLTVLVQNKTHILVGTIPTITREHLIIRTKEGHINVPIKDIMRIEQEEEAHDEPA